MRSVHSAVMTDALFSMLYTVYVYLLPVYCALDTGEHADFQLSATSVWR